MIRVLDQKLKANQLVCAVFDLLLSICGELNLEEEVKKTLDSYNIKYREIK